MITLGDEMNSVHSASGSKSLPAEHEGPVAPQWISVRERLPDEDEDGSQIIGCFQYPGGSRMVGAISTSYLRAGMHERVTHWMPLPEPPKSEIAQEHK